MHQYIARRLIQALGVVFITSVVIFVATRLMADPLTILLPQDASMEQENLLRQQLGLDQPIYVQYVDFFAGLLRGDFGISWVHRKPAIEVVLIRLPASLQLAGAALMVSLLAAIPLGLWAGYLRSTGRGWLIEKLIMVVSLFGVSAPSFWLAIFGIFIFSVKLGWLPTSGKGTLAHAVMPVMILAVYNIAVTTRLTRSGTLSVMTQDYIRTARAGHH
ncbi:MAG: ABC transporter permease [Chloroflexi bacterium]|nr:ABC transporter permease [Chloroflexota bacterium]